jgi:lipopolysaccharide export system permease protein
MLWKRYLLSQTLAVFFLFLFCFFFVYAAIDYSTHIQEFIKDSHIQWDQLFFYYLYSWIKRADLLIPLALLVASIKVLTSLSISHELLALQTAGLSRRRLLRPFFCLGLCCTLFNYVNFQFLTPPALNFLDAFHRSHFHRHNRESSKESFHILQLKDGSQFIYQSFDVSKNAFFDVLWIRSVDDLWHARYVATNWIAPQAEFADHIQRNAKGRLEKTESFETVTFKDLKRSTSERSLIIPYENRPLLTLFKLYFIKSVDSAYHRAEILTYFFLKSLLPLLPLFTVTIAACFCFIFRRDLSLIFLYAFSIFGFLAFYLFIDAASILSINRIVSPVWAIGLPFLIASTSLIWKYKKTLKL